MPAPTSGAPIFPLGVVPGNTVFLHLSMDGAPLRSVNFLEVRYRHGADPGTLLSDLWQIERSQAGSRVRLSRVWRAQRVEI